MVPGFFVMRNKPRRIRLPKATLMCLARDKNHHRFLVIRTKTALQIFEEIAMTESQYIEWCNSWDGAGLKIEPNGKVVDRGKIFIDTTTERYIDASADMDLLVRAAGIITQKDIDAL